MHAQQRWWGFSLIRPYFDRFGNMSSIIEEWAVGPGGGLLALVGGLLLLLFSWFSTTVSRVWPVCKILLYSHFHIEPNKFSDVSSLKKQKFTRGILESASNSLPSCFGFCAHYWSSNALTVGSAGAAYWYDWRDKGQHRSAKINRYTPYFPNQQKWDPFYFGKIIHVHIQSWHNTV